MDAWGPRTKNINPLRHVDAHVSRGAPNGDQRAIKRPTP